MKNFLLLFHIMLMVVPCGFCQTYTGTGGTIPDNGNSISFQISVSGLPTTIDTTTFGLQSVCINATHTWDDDLTIYLIAPDSTFVTLTSHAGGDGDNYTATCFNASADTVITNGTPPFTGNYKPVGQMGLVNNGQNPNGIWTLFIIDTYPFADQGTLLDWTLNFGTTPATYYSLFESNLPVIVIHSQTPYIGDDPKVMAHMGIVDNINTLNHPNDSFNGYDGWIGIEVRGASSQIFPKKSFRIETRDSNTNNLDVSLLGMPADNDWALIANYHDKSLMRNYLSYQLFRDMGHYAPRTRFCDVVVNGEYMGVYLLCETIKRGKNRVDIAKLDSNDIAGDSLTGGYIFRRDGGGNPGWNSNFVSMNPSGNTGLKFQYFYPESGVMKIQQRNYLKAFVDSFELALNGANFKDSLVGYHKYIDLYSWIDMMLLWEFSKNIDGYRKSTYYYKDKNSKGGKIVAGPAWDYDLSYGSSVFIDGQYTYSWNYILQGQQTQDEMPFWHQRLVQDTFYTDAMKCRWNELRQSIFNLDTLFAKIDTTVNLLSMQQPKNFSVWPILGQNVLSCPSPIPTTYAAEIVQLKTWLTNRVAWLDNNMYGTCNYVGIEQWHSAPVIQVAPNPVLHGHNIHVSCAQTMIAYHMYDVWGNIILQNSLHGNITEFDISTFNLVSGVYTLHIVGNNAVSSNKIIVH